MREAITEFLIAAKRQTYAAQGDGASVTPVLPGSRQLEHRDGAFLYRDIYSGMLRFASQETVYREDRPIWSMSYAGGAAMAATEAAEAGTIYAFLSSALRWVSTDHPFRGPAAHAGDVYRYVNAQARDVAAFHGHEAIARGRQVAYELWHSGGLLR